MTTEQETNLREGLQAAYPAAEPSEALRVRVTGLAREMKSVNSATQSHPWRIGLRLAGIAATTLVVLAFLLPPKLTAVQAFERMTASLKDVRSAHYISWNIRPDGTRVKGEEVWYQAGNWRVEVINPDWHQIEVCRDGTRWTYVAQRESVTQDKAAFPAGYDSISGFSISALQHDAVASGNQTHITLLGNTIEGGRPVHTILFYSQWMFDKQEPTWRSRITVDDATNLPIRLETQKRKPVETRWITTETREEDFNQPVSAAVFVPDFPKTAWLIDAVAERDYWRRRLDKGVAASNTVVVRDLQVNANGVVFLLFTANDEVGRDIPFGNVKSVDLTDEFGTRYTDPSVQNNGIGSQNFVPTCMNITAGGEKVAGYLFGEKQLEGRRWVPVEKQTSWKPRQFRLTFHLQNLKSGQADTAVFDLPLQSAEADTVPKYMPYMGRSLSSDAGAEGDEEMDVRAYYLYHIAHDLPAALRAYRELLTYRAGAQNKLGLTYGWSSVQWLEVTHILIELGRIEEAKTALTQAKHDDDSARCSPATHEQIRTEMKKLGMDP